MGPPALLPLRRRRAGDFFALKNPTASAGFEPANLVLEASMHPPDHRSRFLYAFSMALNLSLLPLRPLEPAQHTGTVTMLWAGAGVGSRFRRGGAK
jgi:hypothetical protein